MLEIIKGKLIVSCRALADEPAVPKTEFEGLADTEGVIIVAGK